jgi:hypothetical protein
MFWWWPFARPSQCELLEGLVSTNPAVAHVMHGIAELPSPIAELANRAHLRPLAFVTPDHLHRDKVKPGSWRIAGAVPPLRAGAFVPQKVLGGTSEIAVRFHGDCYSRVRDWKDRQGGWFRRRIGWDEGGEEAQGIRLKGRGSAGASRCVCCPFVGGIFDPVFHTREKVEKAMYALVVAFVSKARVRQVFVLCLCNTNNSDPRGALAGTNALLTGFPIWPRRRWL